MLQTAYLLTEYRETVTLKYTFTRLSGLCYFLKLLNYVGWMIGSGRTLRLYGYFMGWVGWSVSLSFGLNLVKEREWTNGQLCFADERIVRWAIAASVWKYTRTMHTEAHTSRVWKRLLLY